MKEVKFPQDPLCPTFRNNQMWNATGIMTKPWYQTDTGQELDAEM